MSFKYTASTLFWIFPAIGAYSQSVNYPIVEFSGRIIDAKTTAPIHGANIHYEGHTHAITSAANGNFSFKDQAKFPLMLITTSLGYDADTTYLKDSAPIIIKLHPENRKLKEVLVTGAVDHTAHQISRQLGTETLKDNQYKSLAEVLRHIAGVNILNTGSTISKPIVNGLYGNRLAILNNGIKLASQQWGNDHAPEIDIYTANSITVIKGAESLRYGAEALGGVVMLTPKDWSQIDSLHGSLNLTGQTNGRVYQSAVGLEGNTGISNLKFRLNGNYSRSGNRQASDYYLNNTGQEIYNLNAALGYQWKDAHFELSYKNYHNESGILSSTHVGDLASLQERIAYGRPYPAEDFGFSYHIDAPRQKVDHQVIQLNYDQKISDTEALTAKYAFQFNRRQEYDKRRAGRSAIPSMDLKLSSSLLDLGYSKKYANQKLLTGVQIENQVNNNVPGTFNTPLIPNYDSFNLGAYAIYQWNNYRWLYELGARYDLKTFDADGIDFYGNEYGGDKTFHNVSANFGVTHIIDNHVNIKSNIGLAWRAPSAQELYSQNMHQSTARYEKGNPSLSSEQGVKWINSLNIHNNRNLFTVDVYANYINNYIYARPNGDYYLSLAGTFPIWEFTQDRAVLLGTDIQGKYYFNRHVSYHANASYIYARNVSAGTYLPMIAPLNYMHELSFEKENPGSWFDQIQFTIGQEIYAKQFATTAAYEIAPAPKGYQLLNASAKIEHKIGDNTLTGRLAVDNLLNTEYKSYTDLFRYYAHGLGRNIQLSINYSF